MTGQETLNRVIADNAVLREKIRTYDSNIELPPEGTNIETLIVEHRELEDVLDFLEHRDEIMSEFDDVLNALGNANEAIGKLMEANRRKT